MVQHIYKLYILNLKCSKAHKSTILPVTLCSLTIDVTRPGCACTAPAPGSSLWEEHTAGTVSKDPWDPENPPYLSHRMRESHLSHKMKWRSSIPWGQSSRLSEQAVTL